MNKKSFYLNFFLLAAICFSFSSCNQSSDESLQRLIFQSLIDDGRVIYLLDSDGESFTEIGKFPLSYTATWLSPNGEYLLIGPFGWDMQLLEIPSGKKHIEISKVGANNLESLPYQENVAWAPDSNRIVFIREAENELHTELVFFDLNTNTETILTNDDTIYRSPVWSPDGNIIAAVKMQPCTPRPWDCPLDEIVWNIIFIDLEHREQIEIHHDLNNNLNGVWQKSLCNLNWSPDGKFIVFENDCDDDGLGFGKSIYVTSIDGKQLFQLVNPETFLPSIPNYDIEWLDNGSKLYIGFYRLPYTSEADPVQSGYMIFDRKDFNTPIIESTFDEPIFNSQWSPDKLSFAAWEHDDQSICNNLRLGELREDEIILMPRDESIPLGIPSKPNISWSNDNNFFAFSSISGDLCNDEKQEISIINTDNYFPVEIESNLVGKLSTIGWTTSIGD